MICTVAAYKGGVGKSTCAVHVAAYLHALAPTVVVDCDPNRSTLDWSRRSQGQPMLPCLPFQVVDERASGTALREIHRIGGHVVFDTPARPGRQDLEAIAAGCDLLIVPTTPDALSLDALRKTVAELRSLGCDRFKVLINVVPPRPSRDGDDARAMLAELEIPTFAGSIRRAVAFQKASLQGSIVADVKDVKAAEAWSDYVAIGQEIMAAVPQEVAS